MTQPDDPSPTQTERIARAAADLAAAEEVDLMSAGGASFVVMMERLRTSLDDMIRLHHERDHAPQAPDLQ